MKESPEVKLYKQEQSILISRLNENRTASRTNMYSSLYGTKIYNNINSSGKDRFIPKPSSIDIQENIKFPGKPIYNLNLCYCEESFSIDHKKIELD